MKLGKKGIMNIDFSETYDQEDDTYYVTFKTGEPSYCVELDDVLLLEVGLYSKLPTGFRILNFKKNKVKEVSLYAVLKRMTKTLSEQVSSAVQQREAVVERALEKALA